MTEIEFPLEEITMPSEKRSNWPIISSLYTKWIVNVYPRIHPFIYPLAIMFQAGTVWISLVMSVDRFIAIHFPLKSLKFCTISNARKLIALVFIFSLIYCSPRFLEFYARSETLRMFDTPGSSSSSQSSLTIVHTDLTRIGKSTKFRQLVYVWMYVIFQSVIPLLFLTCINVALLISLARSERTIPGGNGDSARSINRVAFARRDITFMIITVVLLFVVLQTPSVVCNCVYGTNYRGSAFNSRYCFKSIKSRIKLRFYNFLLTNVKVFWYQYSMQYRQSFYTNMQLTNVLHLFRIQQEVPQDVLQLDSEALVLLERRSRLL